MKLHLTAIQNFFSDSGFETHLEGASEETPFDQLFVSLGRDEEMRDLTLQVRLYDQILPEGAHRNELSHPRFLDFFLVLPFEVKNKAFPEAARMVSLVNKVTLLPGFMLSETDHLLYYRYIYPSLSEEFLPANLEMILSTILYQVETFAKPLEEVAKGSKSYEEIVTQANQYVQREVNG
ncbi:type III secretion system chaperone family protein [Simkania negevensis]|uniref:Uncharacterized protein n=1 Tax=Simkania negevensis (strain ATCC VR-1471 / DSM 27360 / Z) TaxID=331113 RepID=F8L9C9_SIMNZ|nr:hypothetical protein [Simkania negevensis]MCB1067923.1 hypothetical protein [Simkania sp.]MCB1074377.1 hypothetical protein [Simkania sp.]MCP5490864.1 hypothetical protein [Chlamydiales bacterium]CCB89453.1 putative uncharacterized protein [Simkania negevensis Z]